MAQSSMNNYEKRTEKLMPIKNLFNNREKLIGFKRLPGHSGSLVLAGHSTTKSIGSRSLSTNSYD